MGGDEEFFGELGPFIELCTDEHERKVRKRAPVVKKVPMLLADEPEPLKTILICRHQPEERILIVKDFEDSTKLKKQENH